MKTADEALKEEWAWENPVHAFRDGYNAAIEAMRAESEPVGVTIQAQLDHINSGLHPDIPMAFWHKEASYIKEAIPLYTAPQPLRELTREEVTELWHQATQEEGGIGKVVERFAKLVRKVK